MPAPLVLWRLTDGKPGHGRQSEGLVNALATRLPITALDVDVQGLRTLANTLPRPDLVVGCGRQCQIPLWRAGRRFSARTVYLMRPQLPIRCFDLCLIPRHDGVPERDGVIITDGPLNTITNADESRAPFGMILIGGPSKHFAWDPEGLRQAVAKITGDQTLRWELANSRRTPELTSHQLGDLVNDNVRFFDHHRTDSDWLPSRLQRAQTVWVSQDSMSMVYEALSGGAQVGVLPVPTRRPGRVVNAINDLVKRGLIDYYRPDRGPAPSTARRLPLNESGRCAELIIERWLRP
ncbi:MAG: ELM1/GtrOC1 family putative glycosyltransferase [Pseudomonadota bacterium]